MILQDQLRDRAEREREGSGQSAANVGRASSRSSRRARATRAPSTSIKGSSAAVRKMIAHGSQGRGDSLGRVDPGRERHGQGASGRGDPSGQPPRGRPFVKLHCAALSQSLLESELFGHVKSAFTGADRDRVGRFEQANGGTLFLDEIGDINLEVQTKLLRVLQEMSFERVGSSQPITVDVRILAATHQDLEALIRAGRFREDLYYRLNVICLHTPALRERREDIFELAVYFLNLHAQRTGKLVTHLDPEAVEALVAYDWPGNIRELENVLERAVVLADGPAVMLDDLPPELRQPGRRRLRPRLPAAIASSALRPRQRRRGQAAPASRPRIVPVPRHRPRILTGAPPMPNACPGKTGIPSSWHTSASGSSMPQRSERKQERGRAAARNAPEHLLQQSEETRDCLTQSRICVEDAKAREPTGVGQAARAAGSQTRARAS